jgi:hypothetical protein
MDTDAVAAGAALTEARQMAATTGNPWAISLVAHHLGRLARLRGGVRPHHLTPGAPVGLRDGS